MEIPSQPEFVSQDQSRSFVGPSWEQCECGCGRDLCHCGCRVHLTGRQKAFSSQSCNTRYWEGQHPRVGVEPEGHRVGSILAALLGVLHDGRWYTKAELAVLVKAREHSVGTRLSELRAKGFRIQSDGVLGDTTRAHRFRLVSGALQAGVKF